MINLLNFNEYFLLIKEIQEKPTNGNECKVVQKLRPSLREEADKPAEKEIGGKLEIDHY
jgi:hypothetical protein